MIETPFISTMKAYSILEGIRYGKMGLYGFYSHVTKPFKSIGITNITNESSALVTVPCHGLMDIDEFTISGVVGMTEINTSVGVTINDFTIVDENTILLQNINSSSFGSYISGGFLNILHQNDSVSSYEFGCDDESLNNVRKNILGLKKITGDCVEMVISRNNWEYGVVYDEYSSKKCKQRDVSNSCDCPTPLNSDNYMPYVVNNNGDVYFCINNRNNSISTIEPRHTTPWIETLSDNYSWQYLYTLDLVSDKFVNNDYIPVRDLCVDDGTTQWDVISSKKHNTGEIANIEILDSGSGYTSGNYFVFLDGDGIGGRALVRVRMGVVDSIQITNRGEGYTYASLSGEFSSNVNTACFRVNLFPHYGIGKEQLFNLSPCKIMFVFDFNSNENSNFMVDNNYCGYGLIMNPKLTDDSIADDISYDMRKNLILTNVPSTMQINERISAGTTTSIVTEVKGINSDIVSILPENPYQFEIGDVVSGSLSGSINTILDIEESLIEYGSGAIITYSLDERVIHRDINQRERYRVILEL